MKIDEELKQRVAESTSIIDVLERYGTPAREKNQWVCPWCGDKMGYSPSKKLVKCFHCDKGTASPVTLLMQLKQVGYVNALKMLADMAGIDIKKPLEVDSVCGKHKAKAEPKSFKNRQLEESGLTEDDVRANWEVDGHQIQRLPFTPDGLKAVDGPMKYSFTPFHKGTVDKYGHVDRTGDDMIIQYLDLDGRPVMYQDKRKGEGSEPRPFYRVRWQYPESHPLADGSTCKYKSPAGSGVHIYIPERTRQAYRKGEKVRRLFFTEGEKKSEAVAKYVGPAFGLGGINCLVSKDSRQIPEDIIRFIEECGVEQVYFIMDSDWNDLGKNLTPEKDVTNRPRTFANAAINFRDWFQTLANRNLYIDVFLVLGQPGHGKGVDDVLMMMKPNTDIYAKCIEEGTNDAVAGGHTELLDVVKVSSTSSTKVMEIWHLNDPDDFTNAHLDELKEIKEFTLWKNLCRVNEYGERESVYGLMDDETFWTVAESTVRCDTPKKRYSYNYERAFRFLYRRGFCKIQTPTGDYDLIQITNHRMEQTSETKVQDYVMEFIRGYKREGIDKEEVLNLMHRGKSQYLGRYQLLSLPDYQPDYAKPDRESQVLFFAKKWWRVNADGIEEHPLTAAGFDYWQKDLCQFDAHRTSQPLLKVKDVDGNLCVEITPTGKKCEYLHFLVLTSWFDWHNTLDDDRRPKNGKDTYSIPPEEYQSSLLSKLTAMGYLLHNYTNPAVAKAVIAMDEHISPAGRSEGRSGKSMMSFALQHITNVCEVPGKSLDLAGDRFVFEQVSPRTRVITLDDIEEGFNFEQLFPSITSGVTVNGKGVKRFTLSGHDKPKFLITTNHTILDNSGSARDRQFIIAFSNFFDADYKTDREFDRLFFSEDWDEEQWNLYYNLMAECLEIYFLAQRNKWGVSGSGLIPSNCASVTKRRLRQAMRENFYEWMVDFLGIDEANPYRVEGTKLCQRIERPLMFEAFMASLSQRERSFITPNKFRDKVLNFCHYFGYVLNPNLPQNTKGEPVGFDKGWSEMFSKGVEWYTITPPSGTD